MKDKETAFFFMCAITITAFGIGIMASGIYYGAIVIALSSPSWYIVALELLERFPRKTDQTKND